MGSSVATFDQVREFADGGDRPVLEGLSPAGVEYWESEFGREEANGWVVKHSRLRETAEVATADWDAGFSDVLLRRPLEALVGRLNRRGGQYVKQVGRSSEM